MTRTFQQFRREGITLLAIPTFAIDGFPNGISVVERQLVRGVSFDSFMKRQGGIVKNQIGKGQLAITRTR